MSKPAFFLLKQLYLLEYTFKIITDSLNNLTGSWPLSLQGRFSFRILNSFEVKIDWIITLCDVIFVISARKKMREGQDYDWSFWSFRNEHCV